MTMKSIFGAIVLSVLTTSSFAQRPEPSEPEPAPVVNTKISALPSGTYQFSGYHSQVVFWVMHQMISPYYMRFNKFGGTVRLDTAQPGKSEVHAVLDLGDLSTPFLDAKGERFFDKMLCKPEMLDCDTYKTIEFTSTSVTLTGQNTGDIRGNLKIRDVVRPVVLHATFNGSAKGIGNRDVLGFSATASFKRSDFGLTKTYYNLTVSDTIEMLIEAELSMAR